jgi:methionine-rich copper-binding protein CopC
MRYLQFILLFFLFCVAPTATIEAHAFLDHASPGVGSKVHGSPTEVRVWFTEPVEPVLSSIKVFDAKGRQIDKTDAHLDPKNKALLRVSLPSLTPGTYKVVWHVVSTDTHVTNGDFTFRVTPDR